MKILGHETIYRDEQYVAFPNLARLSDGTVICAFRHARERQKEYGYTTHIDPTAKDVFVVSPDGGATFGKTLHVIIDDEMSDQDPCVNVLRDGRIIVTYFRWALVPAGEGAKVFDPDMFAKYGRKNVHGKYDCYPDGASYSISDDNGKTWRHMPHLWMDGVPKAGGVRGNIIEMPDGSLLMPFYGALTTNCDLPTRMAKGLHRWPGTDSWLHVSAGLGTHPTAPIRFACRPEATILTLIPR